MQYDDNADSFSAGVHIKKCAHCNVKNSIDYNKNCLVFTI